MSFCALQVREKTIYSMSATPVPDDPCGLMLHLRTQVGSRFFWRRSHVESVYDSAHCCAAVQSGSRMLVCRALHVLLPAQWL